MRQWLTTLTLTIAIAVSGIQLGTTTTIDYPMAL
jgi:hypothetical protein